LVYTGGNISAPDLTSAAGTGTADFLNTLAVSAIEPLDADMNPVLGATIVSESDIKYNVANIVPEPGYTSILFVGLAAVIFVARRKSTTAA
jgi:hypothetical protein